MEPTSRDLAYPWSHQEYGIEIKKLEGAGK
jgi:hypothetical protein